MNKIKIMTDSTSDIPADKQKELGIDIMNYTIIADGKEYRERQELTNEEFYEIAENSSEMPKHSQLTMIEFIDKFEEAAAEGYTDLIHISISSTGSATYNNAVNAAKEFSKKNDKLKIHIVDSKGYSGMYGYAVIQAAIMANNGESPESIVSYIEEWTSRSEAHFIPLSLKFVKKSGRITAAAAFAGELLGLRPLVKLAGGGSEIPMKIRGEKNIIPKLLEDAEKNMQPHTPYLIITGRNRTLPEKLAVEAEKKFGYPPEYFNEIGATVTCNTGPDLVGFIFRRRDDND